MGQILMSQQEFKKYRLAIDALEGKLTIGELSEQLGKSYRQTQRIVSRIRDQDVRGAYHGNCGKIPHNKTAPVLEHQVLDLLKGKYVDFNLTHFREKLVEVEGIVIGKNALYGIAKKQGLVKQPKRRGRRSHRPRARLQQEGMMVQFDGSEHCWFGNQVTDLIAGIDDATGRVLAAEFFYGETSLHSMKVISEIASNIKVISSSLLLTFAITSVWMGCATKSRQVKNEREAGCSRSRCLLNKW